MNVKIRLGVFETNSSTTHSLTMCTREEFDAWEKGDLVYNNDDEAFVPIDSLSDDDKKLIDEDIFYTYEGYFNQMSEWFDTFTDSFISPKGEEIIGFGYYGHD